MNIKITYNWLLEYLETDATPYELQKYLSLCGPSFETVEKVGDDYVFDIEITSNRVDMASVFGIAQEAQAILPQFGKKAKLKFNPLKTYTFSDEYDIVDKSDELEVEIKNHNLISRFTTVLIKDVEIKKTPKIIRERLEACGIQSINNIVDISNYTMLSLGQPTHMFDYDKIVGRKIILRESKKGEILTTLDGKKLTLPGGDIVIEDGSGKLIDLCGIMGGENSQIGKDTKNVLFFVQTYDKKAIRKTSMTTGQRTVAATYFEKGLDPSRVENAVMFGLDQIKKAINVNISKSILDIYKNKTEEKSVRVYLKDIYKIIGIVIEEERILKILTNLGFVPARHEDNELAYPDGVSFEIKIPSFRYADINHKEDVIEEVARVYGYHNLPNNISPQVYIKQPKDIQNLFNGQNKIKKYLKHVGFHEFVNYSMVSKKLLENFGMDASEHLKISNTISKDIEYMRRTLTPSIVKNIKENIGYKNIIKIFEIAKIYLPKKGELPEEQYVLGLGVSTDFFDAKGAIEGLFEELNIDNYSFVKSKSDIYSDNLHADILVNNKKIGRVGRLKLDYQEKMNLGTSVYVGEIDLLSLVNSSKIIGSYIEPAVFSVIKLDATFEKKAHLSFKEIKDKSLKTSKLLTKIEYLGSYKNNISLRFYFSSARENITEETAKSELQKILGRV